jgi:hypothetical protein
MAKRKYEHAPSQTKLPFDITNVGSTLRIAGLVFQGETSGPGSRVKTLVLFLPETDHNARVEAHDLSSEQWSAVLRQSDDPVIKIGPEKILVRKVQYAISGAVQQKIWARDSFRCMVCGRQMGEVQLTIDHWMPLELGGSNDTDNYISLCRACNKRKGSLHPLDFCNVAGISELEMSAWIRLMNKGELVPVPSHLITHLIN